MCNAVLTGTLTSAPKVTYYKRRVRGRFTILVFARLKPIYVIVKGRLAEICSQSLHAGNRVLVSGELRGHLLFAKRIQFLKSHHQEVQ